MMAYEFSKTSLHKEGDRYMLEAWFTEMVKGIGKLFLNPLLYWAIFLIVLAGMQRIKRERKDFGIKLFDVFSEWKYTWATSIILGVIISALTIGLGIVFSYSTVLLLCLVTILVSITGKFSFLSASYTFGISYVLLLFLPFLLEKQDFIPNDLFSSVDYSGFTVLLAMLLFAESMLLLQARKGPTYPELTSGNRGGWVGQHHIRKMSIIPFFILIPSGSIAPFAAYWPYFTVGGESYSLLLVPFIVGFNHLVRGSDPVRAAGKLANTTLALSIVIWICAFISIYYPWFSAVGIISAIVGREFINYRHRSMDQQKTGFFQTSDKGLKVLAVLPGSPADRLEIVAGETITKVNGNKIYSLTAFYEALQESGAYFKLELLDKAGENRFLQGALYEGDHHELGIIFTSNPHRKKEKEIV